MSTTEQTTDVDVAAAGDTGGIGQAIGDYFTRVKGGDVGSLPAVLGLIVLFGFFTLMKPDTFFSIFNFANLLNQCDGDHRPGDGPRVRPAARRDRPVRRLHRRNRCGSARGRHGVVGHGRGPSRWSSACSPAP